MITVRLRSANTGNCNNTWNVNTSGNVNNNNNSTNTLHALPIANLKKAEKQAHSACAFEKIQQGVATPVSFERTILL